MESHIIVYIQFIETDGGLKISMKTFSVLPLPCSTLYYDEPKPSTQPIYTNSNLPQDLCNS